MDLYSLRLAYGVEKRMYFEVEIEGRCANEYSETTTRAYTHAQFEKALPYLLAIKRLESYPYGYLEREVKDWPLYYTSKYIKELVDQLEVHVAIPSYKGSPCVTIEKVEISWYDAAGTQYIVDLNGPNLDEWLESEIPGSIKVG